jgi:hypothetical protein
MADSGGFGRSEAAEKANEFVISGLFWKVCQACKTSTPGSNPGGASKFFRRNQYLCDAIHIALTIS